MICPWGGGGEVEAKHRIGRDRNQISKQIGISKKADLLSLTSSKTFCFSVLSGDFLTDVNAQFGKGVWKGI